MERLVAGRERIYLDRFWNEFSGERTHFTEASREHYAALYAMPGAMHAGFAHSAGRDRQQGLPCRESLLSRCSRSAFATSICCQKDAPQALFGFF
jgi:hypothetical protein